MGFSDVTIRLLDAIGDAVEKRGNSYKAARQHLEKLDDADVSLIYKEVRPDVPKRLRAKKKEGMIDQIIGGVCRGHCFLY